ncbi:MAG: winged helix DNA-binding protein [Nanoarchaeota archaeon]|nr:winged helix DNA-binding protein [Nanoarchaeota archaeon]
MHKLKVLTYVFIGLFLLSSISAATIYGTVYDLSLKKVNNARVEINTSPKQFIVAQNGSYSFNVPNGAYVIKAQLIQKNTLTASVQENTTIKQDGYYVLDLILFPDVEEGVEDIGIDVNVYIVEKEKNQSNILAGAIILLILAIILTGLYYFKRTKNETTKTGEKGDKKEGSEDDDLWQIIKIIKHEGGRTTQKDIRKQIPLSEAKISLMIAELEHKGVIEKIKKGRGNIIILKRK